jgi:tetratricopeptide (TPR) repeat protein
MTDINNIDELNKFFESFQEKFNSGEEREAAEMLGELLEDIEGQLPDVRAGSVDERGNITALKDAGTCNISLNHVMEYYIYSYYYKPDWDVAVTQIPIGEYYRTHGELCIRLSRFKEGAESFKNAICWNPVDLDAILGLAECYKNLNMLERYLIVTKQAYRYCCTRATMARYYRNMGYYYVAKYKPEVARACYIYSNIYYKTENADNELKFIEEATKEKTPELTIPQMQEIFRDEEIEPGPSSDTIGVIYRVGEIMMEDSEFALARDCFSIVYDITREKELEPVLDELDRALGTENGNA